MQRSGFSESIMGIIKSIGWLVLVVLFASCNATRIIKPLEKGEKAVSAGFGGPSINFAGAPIPVPLTSISYAHGIDTGLTLAAGLNTTSLAFGVVQADISLGINVYQTKAKKFGLTATPAMHFMYDFNEGNYRNYPQLEAITWWQYGEKPNLFYGGVGTWVELNKTKAHGQVQTNELLPWVTIGHQFNRAKWSYLTELKYLGFQHETFPLVVDYVSPGGRGTIGVYIGISRRFTK